MCASNIILINVCCNTVRVVTGIENFLRKCAWSSFRMRVYAACGIVVGIFLCRNCKFYFILS